MVLYALSYRTRVGILCGTNLGEIGEEALTDGRTSLFRAATEEFRALLEHLRIRRDMR